MPEGIAVTFGKEMIEEKGGLLRFIRWFEGAMKTEDELWLHKCRLKPKFENLLYVYVIIANRVHFRCYYGGYGTTSMGHLQPDGPLVEVPWPHVILAGPFEKAPYKIIRPGFRGFRYTTKLF